MIDIHGLTKRYGDTVAVDHGSLAVSEGEVLGLIGPNGAGKTTTLKMLAGLIDPTSGSASVAGQDVTATETANLIGFLPETSPLYEDMTAVEYLLFFADLYNVDEETARKRIHSTLDRLQLVERDRRIGNLSKGMRRKVAIAQSLINDPPALIYDEPASGLDPVTTEQIIEFTRDLRDEGKAILFSAHDLQQVESVCDRVAMMNNGRVVEEGTIQELRRRHANKEYLVITDVPVPGAEERSDGNYYTFAETVADVGDLRESAESIDGSVVDIETRSSALQDVFLNITESDSDAESETPPTGGVSVDEISTASGEEG